MELATLVKHGKKMGLVLQQNSPTILTGLSVAGLVTTVVMAIQATPKALYLMEELRELTLEKNDEDPTVIELTRVLWRPYLPTVLMGGATIFCIIGSNSIHLRRNAALMSLYSLTETTLKTYQEKVVSTIGKNKEEILRGEIAQDDLDKNPVSKNTVIITGKGDFLFYDSLTGRYFRSDIEKVRKIQNDINHQLLSDMFVSLNDFYWEMGLEPTELGGQLGWSVDYARLDIQFSAKLAEDGQPCVVLNYKTQPKDFRPGFA